ncbi:MAG TPA: BON domain-containing protein [Longimicrobiaceae bacterium]|nr:BON domain-containing protein [Longimicrobiaceae bacterium]
MWEFRERDDEFSGQDAAVFALGAVGGLALGLLLSGRLKAPGKVTALGGEIGRRARGVASRLRPGRLQRAPGEQSELTRLEDAVIEAFLGDALLGDRAIDVGAVSRGIVELSGTVWTDDEAQLAVRLARRVAGVDTVVNRMEVEDTRRRRPTARDYGDAGEATPVSEWQGRTSGMGRRRQGNQTEPDRSDDSRHHRERALKQADHDQFESEGMAANPLMGERPEWGDPVADSAFREDELDNQDPKGTNPGSKPGQQRTVNVAARVGEGPKPGTELALEAADVPVKPHGDVPRDDRLAEDP